MDYFTHIDTLFYLGTIAVCSVWAPALTPPPALALSVTLTCTAKCLLTHRQRVVSHNPSASRLCPCARTVGSYPMLLGAQSNVLPALSTHTPCTHTCGDDLLCSQVPAHTWKLKAFCCGLCQDPEPPTSHMTSPPPPSHACTQMTSVRCPASRFNSLHTDAPPPPGSVCTHGHSCTNSLAPIHACGGGRSTQTLALTRALLGAHSWSPLLPGTRPCSASGRLLPVKP